MSPITRRQFISSTTLGAASIISQPLLAGAPMRPDGSLAVDPTTLLTAAAPKKCPIGVQLYSVRNDFAKDVPGTLAGIKKIGFDGVEFAGYAGKTAAELKNILDDNGLKTAGSHIQGGLPALQQDAGFQKEVDFNKTLGNDRLIIASGGGGAADQWAKFADDFTVVAAKLKPLGLRIGYHNHTGEFTKTADGQVPEYVFFDKASPDVFVQLDVGHCVHGGGDPVEVIKRYNARLVSMHIKDWNAKTHGDIVGEGDVKWKDVLDACAASPSLQWYTIEEEVTMSGLASIEKCFKNWSKILAGQPLS
jgi:sugar phosphate isomerase/epimerase